MGDPGGNEAPAREKLPDREQEAKRVLEGTLTTPGVARGLVLLFLLTLFSVPVLQHAVEIGRSLTARRGRTQAGLLPQVYDVFSLLPSLQQVGEVRTPLQALDLLPKAADLKAYEEDLEDESVVSSWILPRAQALLTRALGVGNEQAYLGRDGWLFYRPEVDYLTSRGFLEPAALQARARESGDGEPVQPDPLKAILGFRRQLAARGIDLVLMPVPVKPMIQPEMLSARFPPGDAPLQNPSYRAFRRALERQGVSVFDVSQTLARAKRETGRAQYLKTDTHWTPEAMDRAAEALARFLQARGDLPERPTVRYTRRPVPVEGLGDIALMLKLPPGQRLYRPQRVQVQQVTLPDGRPWRPVRDADILLLGDSFSNIYSLAGMGWGSRAGLAEQLSFHLRRPVDRIVINAGGSWSTRQRLCQELARGRDRLKGKRVVVWEFAMRDLLVGDWKLLNLTGRMKNGG